jgi:putative DNA methylase
VREREIDSARASLHFAPLVGAAAELVAKLGAKAEVGRELAYRLYIVCERKKRAAEALSYNGLVQSWPEITRLAREGGTSQKPRKPQGELFE